MCGIAGILTNERDFDALAPLRKMQEALKHRGPDDAGFWSQRDGLAHFGHTRLSVLDLSSAGHQPMSTTDGRFCITFNGEIYNFAELRAGLERDGATFHTRSDTEVILRLYERHGADCVKLLRGMFAFALWDERERSCVLIRDHFGIKPLYVTQQGGRLTFASELRAIQASGLVEQRVDGLALKRYLQTGSVPEPLTMIPGVHMLEAGCTLRWQDGKTQSSRWWNISFGKAPKTVTAAQAAAQTRAALLDSVEHHFVSDVPVGIFLSGGVDSTAILALAHATGRRNIRTFSIGVDDAAGDESALAHRTAEHFGTEHTELHLDAEMAGELFEKFLHVVDQPTIDGFNTYCVAGLAREHGMKVVLSGLGGDELFGGYPSFARLPLLRSASRALGPLRRAAGALLQKLKGRPPLVRLGAALYEGGTWDQLYDAFRGVFSSAEARQLAEWLTGGKVAEEESNDSREAPRLDRDRISAMELSRYMRNQLLRDSDVMSMAHGLELRVPLVDSALFEVVSRIPADLRLQPGKQLLLDAVPEIPEWIRSRPKSGFLFPYEEWLSSPAWQAMFAETLREVPVPTPTWYQRWALFVFRHWQKSSGVSPGSDVGEITILMRVLHIIPSLDARDGGPSVALPLMARSLAMQGITVDVATTMSEEDARNQGVRFEVPVERDGFTVRFFKRQTTFYKVSLSLLRWLHRHVRDYALVHNHAVFSFAPLAGAWAARRSGVPYLVRPLGLLNEWGMKHRRRWIKGLSFRLLDGPALNHAAAVHYTSTEEKREAARLNLKSKAVVVPLGIDLPVFQALPDKEVFQSRFPATRGRAVVLFVSRLDPKKGIELLLAAFADARKDEPGAILVIAGSGTADYEAKLKMLAGSLQLDGHVIWPGFLEGAEKLSAYSASSLFVLPSYSENFGIALVEAMAAGVACISSDRVAAVADAGDAVEVVPCEKEALLAAMVRLLKNGDTRASLGRRASATAQRLWSLETTGARLAEIYREVAH